MPERDRFITSYKQSQHTLILFVFVFVEAHD